MGKTNDVTHPEGYVINTSPEGPDWNIGQTGQIHRSRNSWSRSRSEVAFRRSSVRISVSLSNLDGTIRRHIVCAHSDSRNVNRESQSKSDEMKQLNFADALLLELC
jgi:hypothetical protein